MNPTRTRTAALALIATAVSLAPPAHGQATSAPPAAGRTGTLREAPFRVLDNVEGAHVDLSIVPIRPLAVQASTGRLYALNTHDSAVQVFEASGALVETIRVPWGPVALALWQDGVPRSESLLVVCRGTTTLARIDLASGEIVSLLELPTEPADIVVHGNGNAFVSCAGASLVVEIDVASNQLVRHYPIASEAPTFLTLEGGDVLVAPMLSGNNSMTDPGNLVLAAGGRVLDLEDPLVALQGLPDHDLFRITPGGAAVPAAKDMGTVLFAVGVNPATGDIWQLGTEAHNKDPNAMGEPAIRGDIVTNQIALAPGGQALPVPPFAVFDLDDSDPATAGVQFDPTRTVGQPYALDFDTAGNAYVTGLLTDNVTQLTAAGAFMREWNVGSIPRGLVVNAAGDRMWVHCWGTNTVEEYDLSPGTPSLLQTLDLGYDPTPEFRASGRQIFYNGAFSMHNNASCNTCHIEAGSDMLVWDLSNLPFDDKGPLTTQTMVGIADLAPMHWRGERNDLIAFNGAFDGLLGGTPLDETPGGAFDRFQAFLFGLQQPANPNENPRRLVDATTGFMTPGGTHETGDAVRGQDLFFEAPSITAVGACVTCHQLPTGTNNDIVLDDPTLDDPRRNHRVVASFNGIWRKEQPTLETVVFADATMEDVPTLGVGLVGSGVIDSLFEFVSIPLFDGINAQERKDITAFVMQIDSGLAPAVHSAWLLGATDTLLAASRITGFLMSQAQLRNVDVAVIGTVDVGMGTQPLRWFWDRETGLFESESSAIPAMPFDFFFAQANQGLGSNVFLGLPVGMAERFAVDFDADELRNLDEVALGTDMFNPDTDGDLDFDGHEVLEGGDPLDPAITSNDTTPPVIGNLRLTFVTTRMAKIQFDTNELTRVDAAWTLPASSGGTTSDVFEKNHTVLLRDLRANRNYAVALTVTDLSGNAVQVPVAGVATQPFVFPFETVFRNVSVTTNQDSAGTLDFTIAGRARRKGGGGAAGHQVRVKVYVNGVFTGQSFGTTSPGTGDTQVTVNEAGLSAGDEVRAVVSSLFDMTFQTGGLWSMGDTLPEFREFIVTYTGTGP